MSLVKTDDGLSRGKAAAYWSWERLHARKNLLSWEPQRDSVQKCQYKRDVTRLLTLGGAYLIAFLRVVFNC